MPKQITQFLTRLKDGVGGFTAAQKTIAIILLAVLGLGGFAVTTYASKPSMTPLFTGIALEDANAIVEQLNTDKVSYELADGGSTILVPEASVYSERLKAAAAGLPTSAAGGYSLLDKMGVTSSEFQQNTTYKRAIEGELERTISAVAGVKTASVQLAIPKDTVFVREKKDPTASVFVETGVGVTLSTDQVNAVAHLVSASIEGMKPEDVSVVDANGNVLSTVGAGTAGSSDSQASDYEERTRTAVQSMLDRIVGAGNSTVAVNATVSNESAQVTTEEFSQPKDVDALSESTETEKYTGNGGGTATGVLGPDNIAVPAGEEGSGSYDSEKAVKNNAVNKKTEVRQIPAGGIAKQTVSVAINDAAAKGVSQAEIQDLVAAAAGIDNDRGDQVAVQVVGFSEADAKAASDAIAEAKKEASDAQLGDTIRTGVIAAALAVVIIFGLILFFRRGRRREEIDIDTLTLGQSLDMELPAVLADEPEPVTELLPEMPTLDSKRDDIARIAAQNPEKAAQLLRSLNDRKQ